MRSTRLAPAGWMLATIATGWVALLPGIARAGGGTADPLWQKAVALAARAEDLGVKPGTLEMESVVKKKDGKVVQRSSMTFRILHDGDESRTEVVSATQDGKDVTQKVREEEKNRQEKLSRDKSQDEGKDRDPSRNEGRDPAKKADSSKDADKQEISLSPGYHPFQPDLQPNTACDRLEDVQLEGRRMAVFHFRQTGGAGKEALEGRAWLDPESGVPFQVEVGPSPLPKHVDAMLSTVRFEPLPDSLWVPSFTQIRGEGGMLWIHRMFESSFRLGGWHREGSSRPAP